MDSDNIAKYFDHTLLRPDATGGDIIRLCDEAVHYGFASVCIQPVFVPLAVEKLTGTAVKVCTVAGFPFGAGNTAVKAAEAGLAVLQGALEVDMVIWIGALREGKYEAAGYDIERVVQNVREVDDEAIVKVIIETCLLTDEEKIKACQLAESAGAHFVKTSTGYSTGGATAADIRLMRRAVGPDIGVKASGGIKTAAQVMELIQAGATRIGASAGVAIMHELAASSEFGVRSSE